MLLGIAFRFCGALPRLFPPRRTRRQPSKYAHYNSLVATYHVENFGCRATQADGAAIERQLLARGLERASADQDARAAIRRIHRENPAARILVTGCYAQRAPEETSALPGEIGRATST